MKIALFLLFVWGITAQPTPPIDVYYTHPGVRIAWSQPGCIVIQAPQRPLVWPEASCGTYGGFIALTASDNPNYSPVAGMKVALVGFDGITVSSVTLDERATWEHAVVLPLVVR